MRGHVTDHLVSLDVSSQGQWLQSFDKALVGKVDLVVIEVRDLADAFLLFETLNDRGLQLSAGDLLKSHLLGQIARTASDEEVEEAAGEWDDMLEDLGVNVDVSRFLRHYLLGSLQTVKKDAVFGHFKSLVAKNDSKWVLQDIRSAAKLYGEFEDPSPLKHAATKRVLLDLQTLRATVCYVALLPARRYLSVDDFVDFARLVEVLTYRYSSVVGLGTNDLERKYRDVAHLLNASKGGDLEKARSILLAAMPDSETFKLSFGRMRMGTQYLLRYTLRRIEEHIAPSVEKRIKANNLVHIEHIMPQKLSDPWKETLGADAALHDEYVNKYGNLTLLFWSLNIPASNSSFSIKQKYYEQSQVEMTQQLVSQETWGIEQIDQRQQWLAEIADIVWAVEPGTHTTTADKAGKGALERFENELGELWSAVSDYCVETSAEEILGIAEQLPRHLIGAASEATAKSLADRLSKLVGRWEELDGFERSVVSAAVTYFLEVNDKRPDEEEGGLDDDEMVVAAAESALR